MVQGDTIAAIASAIVPNQGSIGIVRLSGEGAIAMAQQVFRAPGNQPWDSHRILYGHIRHPHTQELIDEGLLLLMRGPRSFTREDVVEFHCHGGIIPVQAVLQLCLSLGARLAEPGEFSLRAFLNGRIDLTQAEAIAELVGAKSPQAAQVALAGIQGKLAQPIRTLRSHCLDILAEVEARIDFEDDLPPLALENIKTQLHQVASQVAQILATAEQGELLRTGLKIAIVGRPNVGKSSLLNAWSQSDRAIVTDLPGTTRDVVESQLVVQGIPVQVLDTAGIRHTDDVVERLGVERSQQAAAQADLILFVMCAAQGWTPEDQRIYDTVGQAKPMILVINKTDLGTPNTTGIPTDPIAQVATAAAKNQGIAALETAIAQAVQRGETQAQDLDFAINQRQAAALTQAQTAIAQVLDTIAQDLPLDFWTIDLRSAIQALGKITGEEITESVLDRIFSRFCIGK